MLYANKTWCDAWASSYDTFTPENVFNEGAAKFPYPNITISSQPYIGYNFSTIVRLTKVMFQMQTTKSTTFALQAFQNGTWNTISSLSLPVSTAYGVYEFSLPSDGLLCAQVKLVATQCSVSNLHVSGSYTAYALARIKFSGKMY